MGGLRIIEYSYDLTNKYYYVPIRIVPDPLTEDYVPTDEDLFWMFAGKEPSELNIRWAFREIKREVSRKFKMLEITDRVIEDPHDYIQKTREAQAKAGGCISHLPCIKCGRLHYDTICLCMGIFDCLNCGHSNGIISSNTPSKKERLYGNN